MSLFIGQLSRFANKDELREAFEKFGKLERFELKTGYGFVTYGTKEEAEIAMNALNGKEFSERRICIEVCCSETVILRF
jgi:RNA recognition motif-containing protein